MNKSAPVLIITSLIIGGATGFYFSSMQKGPDETTADSKAGPCPGGTQAISWRNPMNPSITSPVFTKDEMGMDYLPICAEEKREKKVLFYRNPMNPAITSPVPTQDEMGMDYIPVYDDADSNGAAGAVSIDPTVVQSIGVRTTEARRKTISRNIRTVGRVTFDEKRVARLHPKVDGWVEKLFIDTTGEQVKKDTMLLSIYSPQLVASAQEYLLALKNWNVLRKSPYSDIRDGAEQLVQSSLSRLKLLDVADHQLHEIQHSGEVPKALHIHSPFDGVIMRIGAREGQRITPDTELYMVADLTRVWIQVDVYEDELPWVQLGDKAEMVLPAIPGQVFTGRVGYIYPYLESKTRTNKVRIEFENPNLVLKPDMFANITLKASRKVNAIVIPSEAIVRTGVREQVFVKQGDGRFEPREVRIGLESGDEVQILNGIQAGEEVVTSSQFLIDSESKLKEATAKMLEAASNNSSGNDSSSMSMDGMQMEGMDINSMQMPSDSTR